MIKTEQLKELIKAHFRQEHERFKTIALQIAAHEAKEGHYTMASDIKNMVMVEQTTSPQYHEPSFVLKDEQQVPLSLLVLPEETIQNINQVILEHKQKAKLQASGLSPRRKLLLVGPRGTGKTMTARALAKSLSLPLYLVQSDDLSKVFNEIEHNSGVYLFEMNTANEELIRRIERDTSDGIIVYETTDPALLNYTQFDDALRYALLPSKLQQVMMENILGTYIDNNIKWDEALKISEDLSPAEIKHACLNAVKHAILSNEKVGTANLLKQLKRRAS